MKWHLKNPQTVTSLTDLETELLTKTRLEPSELTSPTHPKDFEVAATGIDVGQVEMARQIIDQALTKKWKVVIYGDYDADGICATAVLWQGLKRIGLEASAFIPMRDQHGYGLSTAAIEEWVQAGSLPDLVITVDNGIVAHQAVKKLIDLGVKVIITDHHQAEKTLPLADAIIHSTQLAGVGVAWMLARELTNNQVNDLLDLAAIATIADQVPLTKFNRSIAWHGLEILRTNPRLGIKKLLKLARVKSDQITEETINFAIAPRLNAMGRLAHGLDAFKLLVVPDELSAQEFAQVLDETNQTRKELTKELYLKAAEKVVDQDNEHLLMVFDQEFHEGVIGLIAGRLAEKFFKPAIVMSIDDQGNIKGSARSISGVNIIDLIRSERAYLAEVGGHPMAAGFSLSQEKLAEFVESLQARAQQEIQSELLEPQLDIDFILNPDLITFELLNLIDKFRPFGQQNPYPTFLFNDLKVTYAKTMGRAGEHLSLGLVAQGMTTPIRAVGWRLGSKINLVTNKPRVNLVAKPSLNHYQGKDYLQLVINDFQISSD